ncbi:MAG: hypothetical protein DRI57_13655 [Deltaproteobacteria bacterium]|nr:MAG: hypothetical protein DRI57_13655 [Deltaproteobacteria bacterium]
MIQKARSKMMTIMKKKNRGFTLIELMVVIAISSIVAAAIYSFSDYYQKTYIIQEGIVAMEQGLRASIYYMEDEIRMAGYDPDRQPGGNSDAEIREALNNKIVFIYAVDKDGEDNDGDGFIDESDELLEGIKYELYTDEDGIQKLGRATMKTFHKKDDPDPLEFNSPQPVAEHVSALDFVYLDGNGNITGNLNDIRSVQITIVARAARGYSNYINNTEYYNQQEETPPIFTAPGDHFRRRVLRTQVKCRNLGLNVD